MVKLDKLKFKAVLLHILSKCGQMPNVGKTVLFKMLYFSDFDSYELREKPITGETYYKLPHGPAPSHFDDIISELKEKENAIREFRNQFKGYTQKKYYATAEPDLKLLDGEELRIINRVIDKLSGMNANQISEYSHQDIPWRSTKQNKVIDYELVFYRDKMFSVRADSKSRGEEN